ncbi:polyphosphate kinase 2 [Rhodobacteraceae bacterium NNCM2]|nr:polyphosphate kinase 2 [Coraliihabitans acroporae]
MEKPFNGAISKFFENDFPKKLRKAVEDADKSDLLAPKYPYPKRLEGDTYEDAYDLLQIELMKLQRWVGETGQRIVVVFEGRDAAGKGGTIKRICENLNPRGARVAALPKPSDRERGQWYFQRYIKHLPTNGEIVFYDRSWYNRAVVERVFGFSSKDERELFYDQVPGFENALVRDGIHFFKIWLTISRAEQMRRFLARESDPLKHWKLSSIDVDSLSKWSDYSDAIEEMFERTNTSHAPWHVIRSDDKRRARLAAMELLLSHLDYDQKDSSIARAPNPQIVGGPEMVDLIAD